MIEKMMKAVKRGNKKRSRNITIGAVVGFLLSCTAVMGTDEYLWIKEDNGTIKFSTDNSDPAGTDNPYSENNWDGSTTACPTIWALCRNIWMLTTHKNSFLWRIP